MKGTVNWFEIPIKDVARAKKFYETMLGIRLIFVEQHDVTMLLFPENNGKNKGASGALVKKREEDECANFHNAPMVYFASSNLKEDLQRVTDAGGEIIFPKPGLSKGEFIAHIIDSEGNRIGLQIM